MLPHGGRAFETRQLTAFSWSRTSKKAIESYDRPVFYVITAPGLVFSVHLRSASLPGIHKTGNGQIQLRRWHPQQIAYGSSKPRIAHGLR